MKQNDILLIIVTVVVSIVVSLFASKLVFSSSSSLSQQVEVVPSISTDFPKPNPTYFNSNSIDPTQIINIGPSNNQQPFNSTSN